MILLIEPDKTIRKKLCDLLNRERIIVPEVCEAITREDFIKYFADIDIVERDGNFVVYIDKKPTGYEKLTFHILTDGQKVVFNEHLLMALIKVLDERKEMI
jgi:hypothetical protein